MTPNQKARDIFYKFSEQIEQSSVSYLSVLPKECAKIAVEEIIEQCKDANFGGFGLYWNAVLNEIDNL